MSGIVLTAPEIALLRVVNAANNHGLMHSNFKRSAGARLVREGMLVPPSGTKYGWRITPTGRRALKLQTQGGA